jgi:hypothetical protein
MGANCGAARRAAFSIAPMADPDRPNWRRRAHLRLRRSLPRPVYDHVRLNHSRLRAAAGRGLGRGRVLPDWLLIGAPKAASTTLHAWIAAHPFVVPSTTKEVHFYDYGFYRGEDWYRSHFPREDQREAFAREHGRPFITGESSPTYLSHLWAPRRIAAHLPDVKLVVVLRNPVDRAYSQYQMTMREGYDHLGFQEALEREEERLAPELRRSRRDRHYASGRLANQSYLWRGDYAEHFARWLEVFPRDRFHVVRAEDLAAHPQQTLDGVYSFLGLQPHRPDALTNLHTARYDPMDPASRQWLVEYFRPRNARLAQLVGFDLDWDR